MENTDIFKVILTSSLIATILSAIVSAFVSIKLKHLDYKNEYYKKILEKRLEAYQYLENQIAVLKNTVLDDEDGKPYHIIFSYSKDDFSKLQHNLFLAMSYSTWINRDTTSHIEKLNELFYHLSLKLNRNADLITLGKTHYKEIAAHRKNLEACLRKDLMNLHDLKSFSKEKTSGETRVIHIEKGY
jgi:hypothetical protein